MNNHHSCSILRSLQPQLQPELLDLCRCRKWVAVALRSQSHPFEATPNEACLRGEGSTALSLAVRWGAPRHVLSALLEANVHQIGITHRLRGSILHDASRHRSSYEVFEYLLQRTIDYQETVLEQDSNRLIANRATPEFRHVTVQNSRPIAGPNLLGIKDYLGRTVLHYLVEQVKRSKRQYSPGRNSVLSFFCSILKACPLAIQVADGDGNTPLLLLLILEPTHIRGDKECVLDIEIRRIVEAMLSYSPSVSIITRKLPRPWRFHAFVLSNRNTDTASANPNSTSKSATTEGAMTPLYYALLHGRSSETVSLLLRASRHVDVCGSSVIVTPHHEISLHIAVTTRAPLSVMCDVFHDAPDAVLVPDVYGLTSIDWIWIRHVRDWFADSAVDFAANRIISRRRLLTTQYPEWHEASSSIDNIRAALTEGTEGTDQNDQEDGPSYSRAAGLKALLELMKVLLPGAAKEIAKDFCRNEPWGLLRACCFVPCPVGMIRVALIIDSEASQRELRTRDRVHGRYPLHYASERCTGYCANIAVGVTQKVETLQERCFLAMEAVLPPFPQACWVPDFHGQLPLHIVIDAAKQYRHDIVASSGAEDARVPEILAVELLLSHYPFALGKRDGKTKLFPWQQAAVDKDASLEVIYYLLRREPTLVSGMSN
jgi:hypothetical protein